MVHHPVETNPLLKIDNHQKQQKMTIFCGRPKVHHHFAWRANIQNQHDVEDILLIWRVKEHKSLC